MEAERLPADELSVPPRQQPAGQRPWRPDRDVPPAADGYAADVGAFRQGSPVSRWALARYLVGRAVADAVGTALLEVVAGFAVLAALSQWVLHWTVLAVVLAVAAVGVLLLRALAVWSVRRLTGWRRFGPLEERLTALVRATRTDVMRELRRCGLPGHSWTLPLLGLRLVGGRRRAVTLERLRSFDPARAVSPARLDELHLLVRAAASGGEPPGAVPASGDAS